MNINSITILRQRHNKRLIETAIILIINKYLFLSQSCLYNPFGDIMYTFIIDIICVTKRKRQVINPNEIKR